MRLDAPVLLADGPGTRVREETEFRPKPIVNAGDRLALCRIMKILVHQGISKIAVWSGYKSVYIKSYFPDHSVSILAEDPQVVSFSHHRFWHPMDTFQESRLLNNPRNCGIPSRKVWL